MLALYHMLAIDGKALVIQYFVTIRFQKGKVYLFLLQF